MSARNRQMVLLTVLMVAFVGLLVRQFGPQLGGGPVSRPGRPQSSGPAGVVPDAAELAELRLEALEHKPAV